MSDMDVCVLCEDEGIVAVNFGLYSIGEPRIEPCPNCQKKGESIGD